MLYHDAVSYLSRFTNYERELRYPYDGWHLNLERVRVLLDELGSPERDLPVIHVAGTKGKGSTAAMIEAMARAAGFKTGLYTSPHLLDFKERIRIGGRMIGESDVADMVERMAPAIERVHGRIELGPLTYFEIITAMALAVFARERVDVAVLEAGLGGRFDATNVCNPLVTVLTAVSMDHTDILGDTLEAIAGEKAQIIKAGKPAVIAPQQEAVYGVFRARCEEAGAREIRVAERCRWRQTREDAEGQWADIEGAVKLPELFIALTGEHQLQNAATALVAVDEASRSGITVGVEAMRRGLSSLVWPGRFQRIRRKPDVVLDGAHNGASAEYLARSIRKIYPGRRVTAVIGTHTHVVTADETILPKGTAYLTDAGMTGPVESVIGISIEISLKRFLTGMPARFEVPQRGPCILSAVVIECGTDSRLARSIKRIHTQFPPE